MTHRKIFKIRSSQPQFPANTHPRGWWTRARGDVVVQMHSTHTYTLERKKGDATVRAEMGLVAVGDTAFRLYICPSASFYFFLFAMGWQGKIAKRANKLRLCSPTKHVALYFHTGKKRDGARIVLADARSRMIYCNGCNA